MRDRKRVIEQVMVRELKKRAVRAIEQTTVSQRLTETAFGAPVVPLHTL